MQGRHGADGGDLLHRVGIETDTGITGKVLGGGAQFRACVHDSRPGEATVGVAASEARPVCRPTSHWPHDEPSVMGAS